MHEQRLTRGPRLTAFPGFGTRSTTVVLGRWRASLTGMNWPDFASRPFKVESPIRSTPSEPTKHHGRLDPTCRGFLGPTYLVLYHGGNMRNVRPAAALRTSVQRESLGCAARRGLVGPPAAPNVAALSCRSRSARQRHDGLRL